MSSAREAWRASHRAMRVRLFSQTGPSLRERLYDRVCPLCGVGLGGCDRYVIPIKKNGYQPSNTHNEVFAPNPAPACLVACRACCRLFRGELVARYFARAPHDPSVAGLDAVLRLGRSAA